jgi:hypothetical protein
MDQSMKDMRLNVDASTVVASASVVSLHSEQQEQQLLGSSPAMMQCSPSSSCVSNGSSSTTSETSKSHLKRVDSAKMVSTPASTTASSGEPGHQDHRDRGEQSIELSSILKSPEFITYSVYRIWHKQQSVQFVPSKQALDWFPVTIQAVARVLEHTSSPVHVLLGLLYVARLKTALPNTPLKHPGSEYKILMASLLLAHKFHTDQRIPNVSWGLLCGLQTVDLFKMEMEFLKGIGGKLFVKPRDFQLWAASVQVLHQEFTVYKKVQSMEQEEKLKGLSISSFLNTCTLPKLHKSSMISSATTNTPVIQITPPSQPLSCFMEEDEEDYNTEKRDYLAPLHATLRRKSSSKSSSPRLSNSLIPPRKSIDFSSLPRAKSWTNPIGRPSKRRESNVH